MSTPQTWTWTRITDDPATWPPKGEMVNLGYGIKCPEGKPQVASVWDGSTYDKDGLPKFPIGKIGPLYGSIPDWWCHLHSDQVRETADKMRTTIETAGVRPSQKEILDFLALLGI